MDIKSPWTLIRFGRGHSKDRAEPRRPPCFRPFAGLRHTAVLIGLRSNGFDWPHRGSVCQVLVVTRTTDFFSLSLFLCTGHSTMKLGHARVMISNIGVSTRIDNIHFQSNAPEQVRAEFCCVGGRGNTRSTRTMCRDRLAREYNRKRGSRYKEFVKKSGQTRMISQRDQFIHISTNHCVAGVATSWTGQQWGVSQLGITCSHEHNLGGPRQV